jgi:putative metallohydrolase (TIGR04338 family)
MATINDLGRGKYRVTANRNWEVSYDSHPRHRLAHLPRFLEGNQLKRDRTETDSQRQKLYDAQHKAPVGEEFDSMKEVAREVAGILSKAWWQRRYATGSVTLRPGNGARRARAKGNSVSGNITFPRRHRRERSIIHELIHLTVPVPHAWHGRLYASRYLEAVCWRMGEEAGRALKEGYREENVKWHPRRAFHAQHASKGALRKMVQDCPGWTDVEEVMSKKAVSPPLCVA